MKDSLRLKITDNLDKWLDLLKLRISQLDKLFKSSEYIAIYGSGVSSRNIYLIRSIQNFHRINFFLSKKIALDPENSQMYLCQLRTVADILSRIIYLLSLECDEASRVSICEDSLSLKKVADDIHLSHYQELIEGNFLFDEISDSPSAVNFSKKGLQKIEKKQGFKLLFPEFENRLNEEYLNSKTFNISKEFEVNLSNSLLHAHRSFSHHVHGQHFFCESTR